MFKHLIQAHSADNSQSLTKNVEIQGVRIPMLNTNTFTTFDSVGMFVLCFTNTVIKFPSRGPTHPLPLPFWALRKTGFRLLPDLELLLLTELLLGFREFAGVFLNVFLELLALFALVKLRALKLLLPLLPRDEFLERADGMLLDLDLLLFDPLELLLRDE